MQSLSTSLERSLFSRPPSSSKGEDLENRLSPHAELTRRNERVGGKVMLCARSVISALLSDILGQPQGVIDSRMRVAGGDCITDPEQLIGSSRVCLDDLRMPRQQLIVVDLPEIF